MRISDWSSDVCSSDLSTGGRRRARKRAEVLLDRLEELRLAIALGEVPLGQLEDLARVLSQRQDAGDPELAQIINEIEIRAAVELAKRGRWDGLSRPLIAPVQRRFQGLAGGSVERRDGKKGVITC